MQPETAFQDLRPDACWGCGSQNEKGFQIKSRRDGDDVVCVYTPRPEHNAGVPTVVHGGALSSIIDCHSVWTAISDAYRSEGRPVTSEPEVWCVTAELRVSFLKPTPLGVPLTLRARVREWNGRRCTVDCAVTADGVRTVRAEVVVVRVKAEWKDRPAA